MTKRIPRKSCVLCEKPRVYGNSLYCDEHSNTAKARRHRAYKMAVKTGIHTPKPTALVLVRVPGDVWPAGYALPRGAWETAAADDPDLRAGEWRDRAGRAWVYRNGEMQQAL